MDSITRTANGSLLQTCQYLAVEFAPQVFSTLNEKFSLITKPPAVTRLPSKVGYLCIGNGGHTLAQQNIVDGQGATVSITVPKACKHRGSDAALYKHMPFKALAIADDIIFDSSGYRLRYVSGGTVYYMAKVIDITSIQTPALTSRVKSNGVVTSTPFTYTAASLTPDSANSPGSTTTGSNEFLAASSSVTLKLAPTEIADIVEACNLYYGSVDAAIISELAICAGWDFDHSVTSGSTVQQYIEVAECVVTSFIPYFNALAFSTNGIDLTLDIGAAEPVVPASVVA